MKTTGMAVRAQRLLAIRYLSKAVGAYYGVDACDVADDAARFAGEGRLMDIPPDMHKPVVDYLCGRLLLPEYPGGEFSR
jgi:hypothetical protein